MASDVHTLQGHIPRDQLTTKDIPSENAHGRAVRTEWYLGDKMVRSDAVVHFHGPMSPTMGPGMVSMVATDRGPMHRGALTVQDTSLEDATGRILITEWSHNGQVVRRDQWRVPFVHDACAGSCTP